MKTLVYKISEKELNLRKIFCICHLIGALIFLIFNIGYGGIIKEKYDLESIWDPGYTATILEQFIYLGSLIALAFESIMFLVLGGIILFSMPYFKNDESIVDVENRKITTRRYGFLGSLKLNNYYFDQITSIKMEQGWLRKKWNLGEVNLKIIVKTSAEAKEENISIWGLKNPRKVIGELMEALPNESSIDINLQKK